MHIIKRTALTTHQWQRYQFIKNNFSHVKTEKCIIYHLAILEVQALVAMVRVNACFQRTNLGFANTITVREFPALPRHLKYVTIRCFFRAPGHLAQDTTQSDTQPCCTGSLGPRHHTVRQAATFLHQLKVECLEHPPNCPNLPPNGFHLIGPLKQHLGVPTLQKVAAVQGTILQWFRSQNPDFCAQGAQRF